MDISNRSVPNNAPTVPGPVQKAPKKKFRPSKDFFASRVLTVVLAGAVAVLIIAGTIMITGARGNGEKKLVNPSKLQAVFLNTGQVYFGNITSLNSKYYVLTNIYYLQTSNGSNNANNTNSSNNVTLVKLGCELHQPYDKMVINRDQVTFWENLQDNGQVAKAVSTWVKQNPNGQKCADQSNSSNNTSNTVQRANQNN